MKKQTIRNHVLQLDTTIIETRQRLLVRLAIVDLFDVDGLKIFTIIILDFEIKEKGFEQEGKRRCLENSA